MPKLTNVKTKKPLSNFNVILVNPEIPQNTGNIARTCVATNTLLTLVRPLGFSLSSKHVKRSGLDHWDKLQLQVVDSLEEVLRDNFYFFSSKATKPYTDISFTQNDLLVFGSETAGFPEDCWKKHPDKFYTIPMIPDFRSLNLSNAVAIVLYEALRQNDFSTLG